MILATSHETWRVSAGVIITCVASESSCGRQRRLNTAAVANDDHGKQSFIFLEFIGYRFLSFANQLSRPLPAKTTELQSTHTNI